MPLSWNEIKSRALAFARHWEDASEEKQQSIPFWIDFFEVFGISNRRVASFEHAVKKHGGAQGYIDLFWPGQMLIEQKSRGKPLEPALTQALDYFPGLPERDLPHTLVLCDFARFRVIDLDSRREITFALQDLHKHVRWFGFIAGYVAAHGLGMNQSKILLKELAACRKPLGPITRPIGADSSAPLDTKRHKPLRYSATAAISSGVIFSTTLCMMALSLLRSRLPNCLSWLSR